MSFNTLYITKYTFKRLLLQALLIHHHFKKLYQGRKLNYFVQYFVIVRVNN